MNIVLASASPRRQWLLKELVAAFEVLPADVDEEALTVADPVETARRLSLHKARAVARLRPDALVIGGDTVVDLDGEHLAKPKDEEDARRMLRLLSRRTHRVHTGVALIAPGREESFVETSEVRFRDLTDDEIASYVSTGEPMDKAGAYGLQGEAADFVAEVTGSRNNVIGLPTERLAPILRALG